METLAGKKNWKEKKKRKNSFKKAVSGRPLIAEARVQYPHQSMWDLWYTEWQAASVV
jgi:hypothetical protein